ncbi:GH39 family glycosyl hydrolase [Vagococcus elongatus]|uniref:HTH araC/xylS-type domain-containing protein n=1 Tax=Vagococcus elongatus TaxID=180344 RepID=A0A430AQV6_9ENTE|nr:helix-turn-helix domain-containing protein [Vagococcus elongatus]RSU10511.1 hypothetical protein CBF29_09460 [Vagococcus elongatus]
MNSIFHDYNSEVEVRIYFNHSVGTHCHSEIEFIYVLEGELNVVVEKHDYILKSHDYLIINSNESHQYESVSYETLITEVHISYQLLKSIIKNKDIIFTNDSNMLDLRRENIGKIVKTLVNQIAIMEKGKNFKHFSLVYELIDELCKGYLVSTNQNERFKSNYDERISLIIDYINRNFSSDISLTEISEYFSMSPSYFSRFFKRNFSVNFSVYLVNQKLDKAYELIRDTDASITQIALECGFPNINSFTKAFKSRFDSLPSEYRRKLGIQKNETLMDRQESTKQTLEKLQKFMISNKSDFIQEETELIDISKKNHKRHKINKKFNDVITMGSAKDLLNSQIKSHILFLKKELKIKYVRFSDIFSQEMGIDITSHSEINFERIYEILDFLTENGLKIWLDLSVKNYNHRKDFFILKPIGDSDNVEMATSWKSLITMFIVNAIHRYGIDEVETWMFEICPDKTLQLDDDKKIFRFCIEIYKIFKDYSQKIIVGISGFDDNQLKKTYEFILKAKSKGIEFDFISLKLFPYQYDKNQNEIRSKDENFVLKQVKKYIDIFNFFTKPIYISEWNITKSNKSIINDSCYKGAYIVKNLIDIIDLDFKSIVYCAGSDASGQYFDTNNILNGISGLVTKSGIPKPSFFAFDFANRLDETMISKGKNYLLTERDDNHYTLLCHNYKHLNYLYYFKDEEEISLNNYDTIFENNTDKSIKIKLTGISNGIYQIEKYSVSEEKGSIMNEWKKFGYLDKMNKEQVDYLYRNILPDLTIETLKVSNNEIKFTIDLSANEICLMKITKNFWT